MSLNSYGRLLKDGELKVKVMNGEKKKTKTRNIFLFDQAMIMAKEDVSLHMFLFLVKIYLLLRALS